MRNVSKNGLLTLLGMLLCLSAGAEDSDSIASIGDIRKKFDSAAYAEDFEYPLCDEVVARKQKENSEILRLVLGKEPEALKLFDEMEHFFPSMAKLQENSPRFRAVGEMPMTGKADAEEMMRKNTRPLVYFSADAELYRLQRNGGKSNAETVKMSVVQPGEFVLSTTAHLIEDSRYHKVCWAQVEEVFNESVPADASLAVLHYEGREGNRRKILTTAEPRFFCRPASQTGWAALASGDLKLGMELLSVQDDAKQICRFATLDTVKVPGVTTLLNLKVKWTGAYFVGPVGSEILVQN